MDVAKCSEGIAASGLPAREPYSAGAYVRRVPAAAPAVRAGHPVGMRSIIDFYRSNPVLFALVLVVAILLAMLVLGLGSGSPVQVIALGAVGGLVAGLVIAGSRRS